MVRLPLTPEEIERGQRPGALLRLARGERSILGVALDAHVSPETLRKIETGRVATPAFSTVGAVAAVLGISLDEVWAQVTAASGDISGRGPDCSGARGPVKPRSPAMHPRRRIPAPPVRQAPSAPPSLEPPR